MQPMSGSKNGGLLIRAGVDILVHCPFPYQYLPATETSSSFFRIIVWFKFGELPVPTISYKEFEVWLASEIKELQVCL